ncbi:enoyl-CoA hydratase-related protein [Pseudogulbenkiania ferrooxidans]|uniref:Enoyl-CoA hydratase/isomerase n=1 Tax=Pseudogulbenkiania ferrooxidans 2002 TaxID=279714 RepID=B9Z0D7_9NEIS|nr:enoyl-CoA hydratase-related protein [Pseudogulbenkiania ferrooxidans]EEG09543.1 Enoyl-CoA hydratase/isomerase [Pseudogulbenkiania ferrooxidans 2002]
MSSEPNVLLEIVEPSIYRLTINRPKALNALNRATIAELGAALATVAADHDARVLLVTGAGDKAFVAGADIRAMQDMSPIEGQGFARETMAVFRQLETLAIPVIAVVNGYALGGGCELAMSCDWIVAGENAVFGQPEVNLGLTPGFGGTQRLTRLVGRARALELITTGRQIKADEALRWGLVNHVFPAAQLMDEALTMARQIASKAPIAVRLSKEAVQRGQDLDLDNACQFEAQVFGLAFSTEDKREGVAAFLDKRTPSFSNR